VVQRIPVKIALDATAIELRPGMSVIPTIETQSRHDNVSAPAVKPKVDYSVAER
jgi:membrane fusion protein (multidrug efflux system)